MVLNFTLEREFDNYVIIITICSVDVPKKVEFRDCSVDLLLKFSQNFPKFCVDLLLIFSVDLLLIFSVDLLEKIPETRLFLGHQHCKW